MSDSTYTAKEVGELVNKAANDVDDWADLPDEGLRDLLNLLVNVIVTRAEQPRDADPMPVPVVIEECYGPQVDEEGGSAADQVYSWIHA